jgi:hypothetical protein
MNFIIFQPEVDEIIYLNKVKFSLSDSFLPYLGLLGLGNLDTFLAVLVIYF